MRKVLLGVFLLATFAMTPAFASATGASKDSVQGNELLFSTNGGIPFQFTPSFTVKPNLTIGYQRAVMPCMQAGLRGTMAVSTVAQPWNVDAVATWNFDEKWTEAMFLGAGVGIANQAKGANLDVQLVAEFGKRFELMHGLVWRPTVSMNKYLDASPFTFGLNLINLSYMW